MIRSIFAFFVFALMVFGAPAWASSAAIEAVQMPAWLIHGGHVGPLLPGQHLMDGDSVRTGAGARAYIRLPEGSTVKLGESTQLAYRSPNQESTVFRAALDVLTGAFRFTTAAARKLQKRDVAIRVGNATIGIRGTDVWGRSGKDEDLVMLIEGHIEIQPTQGDALQLSDPLDVFTAPKGGEANPIGKATMEELNARSAETEIAPGSGAVRSGKWKLALGSFDDEQLALARYDQARAAGYGARIRPVSQAGLEGLKYEVSVDGFTSKVDVTVAAARFKATVDAGADGGATVR